MAHLKSLLYTGILQGVAPSMETPHLQFNTWAAHPWPTHRCHSRDRNLYHVLYQTETASPIPITPHHLDRIRYRWKYLARAALNHSIGMKAQDHRLRMASIHLTN